MKYEAILHLNQDSFWPLPLRLGKFLERKEYVQIII